MIPLRSMVVGTALAVLLIAAGSRAPAAAEETGQWFGRAVIVTISSKTVKVDDQPGHILSVSETDGVVFNADGKPFLDKARYQIADYVDGTTRIGYKTFTEPGGSKVFAKYTLKEAKLPNLWGVFEFTGGTGKYAGITGGGQYHVVLVSDTAAWDELRGEYRIPSGANVSSAPATAGMATSGRK